MATSGSAKPRRPGTELLAVVGASALLLALYWRRLTLPFVDNESINIVYSQLALRSVRGLRYLASPRYFEFFGNERYRPLTTVTYALLLKLFNGDPFAFKLAKFLFHFARAYFVYGIALSLFKDRRWSLVAGAVYFGGHVALVFQGVDFLPDLQGSLFCLASLYCYLRFERVWPALFFYLLAVLSRETSLLLPGVFLAQSRLLPASGPRRGWKDQWPFWFAAAAYLFFVRDWVHIESAAGPVGWNHSAPVWAPAAQFLRYLSSLAAADAVTLASVAALPLAVGWSSLDELARWSSFALAWAFCALLPYVGVFPFPKFSDHLAPILPRYAEFAAAGFSCNIAFIGRGLERLKPGSLGSVLVPAALASAALLPGRGWKGGWPASALAGLEAAPPEAFHDGVPLDYRDLFFSLPLLRASDPASAARLEREAARRLPPEYFRRAMELVGDVRLYRDPFRAGEALELLSKAEPAPGRPVRVADESEVEACKGRARGYEEAGDVLSAVQAGRDCFRLPESPTSEALNQEAAQGFAAMDRGDFRGALAHFDAADSSSVLLLRTEVGEARAESLVRLARFQDAGEAYDAVVADCAGARAGGASAYEIAALGSRERRAAREADLLHRGARRSYESALESYRRGKVSRAYSELTNALRASPDFAEARLSRGALRAWHGDLHGALNDYEAGLGAEAPPRVREELERSRAETLGKLGQTAL